MQVKESEQGKKYAHLTILADAGPGGPGVGRLWLCRCDCGNVVTKVLKDIRAGRVKTCGKCQLSRRLMGRKPSSSGTSSRQGASSLRAGEAFFRKLAREALDRGADWRLLPAEVAEITSSECTYCGSRPVQSKNSRKKARNHLDLITPGKVYTPDTVVACCSSCKRMKGQANYVEFLDKVLGIAENIQKKLSQG